LFQTGHRGRWRELDRGVENEDIGLRKVSVHPTDGPLWQHVVLVTISRCFLPYRWRNSHLGCDIARIVTGRKRVCVRTFSQSSMPTSWTL
jgi:hypothetical protein